MQDRELFDKLTEVRQSFVVQVLHRENSTWQGKVKWMDSGEEEWFRSTLELLKLIDRCIGNTVSDNTDKTDK